MKLFYQSRNSSTITYYKKYYTPTQVGLHCLFISKKIETEGKDWLEWINEKKTDSTQDLW